MNTRIPLSSAIACVTLLLPVTAALAATDNSVNVNDLHTGAPRQIIQQVPVSVPGPERVIEVIREVPIPVEPRVVVRERVVEVPGPERIVEVEKVVYRDRPVSLPESGPGLAALLLAGGVVGGIRAARKQSVA
ncbi:MAG: hypothetical protein ABL890_04060 [Candidatus Peribacteraceae bacterium]